jgi:flagellar motor switch protein FliM
MTNIDASKNTSNEPEDPWATMLHSIDESRASGTYDPILGDEEIDRLMGLSSVQQGTSGKAAIAEAVNFAIGLSPAMRQIADAFVETLGRAIRQGVTGLIDVSLLDLSLIRLSNGMEQLPIPSLIATLSSRQLGGSGIVVADQALAATFFDLMLGGGEVSDNSRILIRPYSSIELKLFRRLADFVARGFQEAFEEVIKADFSIDKIETNPYLVSIGKTNENAVHLRLQILFGRRGGSIELLLPLSMFGEYESLIRTDEVEREKTDEADWRHHLVQAAAASTVGLEAVLAELKLPLRTILGFSVGQVIPLHINPQSLIWLKSGDQRLGLGSMGRSQGQIALRMNGPLTSKKMRG